MKKFIKFLIITSLVIVFTGCNGSRVLEENTKDLGLSNYKVTYKYLNSDYLDEGYKFNPLYFKNDELYGLANAYPLNVPLEDYEDNLLYKIDISGNFKEYENHTISSYLDDWQIKDTIKDKNIYNRGLYTNDINYRYTDLENDSLKEIPWIKEPKEIINENQTSIKGSSEDYHYRELSFGYGNFIIYEFNSKYSYNTEDEEKLKDIDNNKVVYYLDMENEKFYISDILKEDPSLLYYYNEEEEAFIKINEDGSYEILELKEGKINFKEYNTQNNTNLNEALDKSKRGKVNFSLKDYSIIKYIDDNLLSRKIIINNNTNEFKTYKKESFGDKDYIDIFTVIPNNNYVLSLSNKGAYLGVINEELEIEFLKEIDFNLDIYDKEKESIGLDVFSNKDSSKILITLSCSSFDKPKYIFNKIQYIYVDIESKEEP